MRKRDESVGFATGLLLGSALGAMAAILLAPKSGRELRSDIVEGGERLKARGVETASELAERGERAVHKTKETMATTAEGLREAAEELRGS